MSISHIPALELIDQRPCTTSLAIATHFEKNHKEVLRDIRVQIEQCPDNFNQRNFAPVEYTDAKGEKRPMYHVFFDGFMLLVMGYTGKKALAMKLAYIEAFNAMKARLEEERHNAPALDAFLRSLIDAKVLQASGTGTLKRILYARAWNSFRAHFGLGKNDSLPHSRMAEAVSFLVQLDLAAKKKPALEEPGHMTPPDSDRVRKLIVEDMDKIEKKLRQLEGLIKWQLCPTSGDAGFTRKKMDYF